MKENGLSSRLKKRKVSQREEVTHSGADTKDTDGVQGPSSQKLVLDKASKTDKPASKLIRKMKERGHKIPASGITADSTADIQVLEGQGVLSNALCQPHTDSWKNNIYSSPCKNRSPKSLH